MRSLLRYFSVFIMLVGACHPEKGASKINALIDDLQEVVSHKDWNGIVKLSINPQDAEYIDKTIIFAPSNGILVKSRCLSCSVAKDEWPEASHLLSKKFKVDYVLLLHWRYPTDNGPAEIQQFFAIHEVNHRYFIVF